MKRRTLDILFSAGGLGVAVLLLVFGIAMVSQANFAKNYVSDQLSQQQIYFTPAENLSAEEAQSACLVEYGQGNEAARLMTTGAQAECYANDYIGHHLDAATGGLSYAQLGTPQRQLQAQVQEAQDNNAANLADLQAQLDQVNAQRDTAFRGETLRGLLLTTYGFSILGEKAALAATVAFIAAGLLGFLAIAGFIHAVRTPETKPFAPVKETVGV